MSQPDTWTPEEAERLGRIANGTACGECMGTGLVRDEFLEAYECLACEGMG